MAVAIDVLSEFRNDHRYVIRSLFSLEKAIDAGDIAKARQIVADLDKAVGPHFRFEEEFLYPTLKRFIGEKRVEELLKYHGGAVQIVRSLHDTLKKDRLSESAAKKAKEDLTAFFVHASDCDGLTLLAEHLPEGELRRLGEEMAKAREWGVPLTQWKK